MSAGRSIVSIPFSPPCNVAGAARLRSTPPLQAGGIEGSLAYGSTKAALIYMAEALKLTYERTGRLVGPLSTPRC